MKAERIDLPTVGIPLEKDHQGHFKPDTTKIHFKNWLDAVRAGDPKKCNNPPDLGAAAIVLVTLGARSYREGKAFHFDAENLSVLDGDTSWAKNWEMMSKQRSKPNQIPVGQPATKGAIWKRPSYMTLAGPWKNGEPPVQSSRLNGLFPTNGSGHQANQENNDVVSSLPGGTTSFRKRSVL